MLLFALTSVLCRDCRGFSGELNLVLCLPPSIFSSYKADVGTLIMLLGLPNNSINIVASSSEAFMQCVSYCSCLH
jgi:hypothetical protein